MPAVIEKCENFRFDLEVEERALSDRLELGQRG